MARRRHPQHHGLRERLPGGDSHQARAELPLDEEHPRGGQCRHRAQCQPQAQGTLDGERDGREADLVSGDGRARRGAVHHDDHHEAAHDLQRLVRRHRHPLPHERPVAHHRGDVHALGHPVHDGRRPQVLRPQGDQGHPRIPARHLQPARHREPHAHHQRAEARPRRDDDGEAHGLCRRAGALAL